MMTSPRVLSTQKQTYRNYELLTRKVQQDFLQFPAVFTPKLGHTSAIRLDLVPRACAPKRLTIPWSRSAAFRSCCNRQCRSCPVSSALELKSNAMNIQQGRSYDSTWFPDPHSIQGTAPETPGQKRQVNKKTEIHARSLA